MTTEPRPLTAEEEANLRAWGGHGEPPIMARVWATLDSARAAAPDPDLRAERFYNEIMRHTMEPDPTGEGPRPMRCWCGEFTERAPHYAPYARHLAAALAALEAAT